MFPVDGRGSDSFQINNSVSSGMVFYLNPKIHKIFKLTYSIPF